jgi:hypothetical protein
MKVRRLSKERLYRASTALLIHSSVLGGAVVGFHHRRGPAPRFAPMSFGTGERTWVLRANRKALFVSFWQVIDFKRAKIEKQKQRFRLGFAPTRGSSP